MIDVVLLGSGGTMPLPDRWLSSLLLRTEGELVLFDCGEGTQIAWKEVGWSFRRLGVICISHTHADHIAGLPGLLHAVANAGRTEPLEIFGPVGTEYVVCGLRSIAPVLPFEVNVSELQGGETFSLNGNLKGRCAAGKHGLPVLAFRVDMPRRPAFLPDRARALGVPMHLWGSLQDGKAVEWSGGKASPDQVLGPDRSGLAVAYVTDTRPTANIVELTEGVDLLVCEGTYGSDEDLDRALQRGHMTFRKAATLARDAAAKGLWITHFSPAVENPTLFASVATAVFPESTIASDGLTTRLLFVD